jgi:hypothetical protein
MIGNWISVGRQEAKGLMPVLLANYMDKHSALNHTAEELTKHGLAFIAAKNLHK